MKSLIPKCIDTCDKDKVKRIINLLFHPIESSRFEIQWNLHASLFLRKDWKFRSYLKLEGNLGPPDLNIHRFRSLFSDKSMNEPRG